ncbi:DUF4349 domain-containing protein [Leucobacter weissii]|uniref:DUF4349 domain-containing protein n=1 Tax=Leucobacter weissii TaxID=1983706 RepID=A0A939MIH2_9MICO|nr:DUF4349 domain-containing protein [Leucobacter weissii]MBO1900860.1 DUF4349 domain-containing protein [Leucobacter weissii]
MKLRRTALAVASALLVASLAACSSDGGATDAGTSVAPELGVVEEQGYATGDAVAANDDPSAVSGRSVVYSGDAAIQVEHPADAAQEVRRLAEGFGGYVESETIERADEDGASRAELQLRVPSERLDEAFAALAAIGTVVSQNRSANDVTAEHVDLQARVAALEASVERLTALIADADNTADLIEAEAALSERQQELDGLVAQLKSLEGRVQEASIRVSLGSEAAVLPGGPANFWEGLVAGWNSIATAGAGLLVVLGVLLPWLALGGVIALAVVLLVRFAKRPRNRGVEVEGNPE